jgi:hypothetical protein
MATNRCPDCNKFVSTDLDSEVEVNDCSIEQMDNGKGLLTCSVHLQKICADCGSVLSSKDEDIEIEIDLSGFESET